MQNTPQQQRAPMDSLDLHHEEFNRSRFMGTDGMGQDQQFSMKNYYRQELDEVLNNKNRSKMLERQQLEQERRQYNERVKMSIEAERIKDLSYKNYYQMILNNQDNLKHKYVSPFHERDHEKEKLTERGVEQGRVRGQRDYENELRRQENIKNEFKTVLSHQLQEKESQIKKGHEEKVKTDQHIRQVLLTPQELEKMERERKLQEMNKYRQDLDKFKLDKNAMSQSQLNPEYGATRSPSKIDRHDLLLNPVPFNIQNPYILKEMQRKGMSTNPSYRTISDAGQSRRNIFG